MKNAAKTALIALLVVFMSVPQVFAGPRQRNRGGQDLLSHRRGGMENSDDRSEPRRPGPDSSDQGRMSQRRGPELPILHYLHALNLTEQQHEQIGDVLDKFRQDAEVIQEDVRKAIQSLDETVMNIADVNTVEIAAEQIKLAIVNETLIKISATGSIKNILTEEQWQQLDEIIRQAKQQGDNFSRRRRNEPQDYEQGGRQSGRQSGRRNRTGRDNFRR